MSWPLAFLSSSRFQVEGSDGWPYRCLDNASSIRNAHGRSYTSACDKQRVLVPSLKGGYGYEHKLDSQE